MTSKIEKYSDLYAMEIFSKRNGNILKGIAILLMYLHHLFGFPERIIEPNAFIPISNSVDIEYYLASFGKICVSMFLFLSGMGLSIVGDKGRRYYLNKVISFYKAYSIVFIIFISFGFIFFGSVNGNEFELISFLKNVFLLNYDYNGEWWFAGVYLLCVIFTPLLLRMGFFISILLSLISIVMYFSFHFISLNVNGLLNNFLLWQVAFVSGLFYYNVVNYLKINKFLCRIKDYSFTVLLIVISLIVVSFIYLKVYALIFFTPVFCVALSMLVNDSESKLCLVLEWLGRKTLYMWLTHTFFCYYYFQGLVFLPKYSILVYLNLILLTIPVCLFLERLYEFCFNSK